MDMLVRIGRFLKDESGISSVEYALLLAFLGGGVAAAAAALGAVILGEMQKNATVIGG